MACVISPDDRVRVPLVLIVLNQFVPKSKRDFEVWRRRPVRAISAILGASAMIIFSVVYQTNQVYDAVLLFYAAVAYLHVVKPKVSHAICDWQSHMTGMVCGYVAGCIVLLYSEDDPWTVSFRGKLHVTACLLNMYCAYLH